MKPTIEKELDAHTSSLFQELLDIYQCRDWGVSWVQFLEVFSQKVEKYTTEWKNENIN